MNKSITTRNVLVVLNVGLKNLTEVKKFVKWGISEEKWFVEKIGGVKEKNESEN